MSFTYYYYRSSSFFYSTQNDENTPLHPTATISIPIECPDESPTPVRLSAAGAATKIQSAYRSHLIRSWVRKILAVETDAGRMEALIRRQETVDAVRRDARERTRMGEALMALLLRLDSVPGIYPAVRELRRAAARRVVALQEVLDAIVAAPDVAGAGGFPPSWEEFLEAIGGGKEKEEDEVVVEWQGNGKKGLECFERFLSGV